MIHWSESALLVTQYCYYILVVDLQRLGNTIGILGSLTNDTIGLPPC